MLETQEKKTLRDYLRIIFRRRKLFLLGASLFAIIVLFGAQKILPVEYTGMTKFERRSEVTGEEAVGRGLESFDTIKLTLKQDLIGRNAIEAMAYELDFLKGLLREADGQLTIAGEARKQEIVRELTESVKITWDVRSDNIDLVSVGVVHRDPVKASRIPDILVKNYFDLIGERIINRLIKKRDVLEKQVKTAGDKLAAAMNERTTFLVKSGSTMPDSPGRLEERVQQNRSDISRFEAQKDAAYLTLKRLNAIEKTLQSTTQPAQVAMGPNPELARLKDKLQNCKDQLDTHVTFYHMTPKHPKVITLKEKIVQLEKQIKETPEEAVLQTIYNRGRDANAYGAQIIAAQSDFETAGREISRLNKERKGLDVAIEQYASARQEYIRLDANVKKEEVEHENYQKRLTVVKMTLGAELAQDRTHLTPVQAALEQSRPTSPPLLLLLGFAILGGLAFGGGLIIVSNMLDRGISTTEDAIKYFNLPVCGVISEIVLSSQRTGRWVKRWVVGSAVTVIVLVTLSVATFSTVLWLRYPHRYTKWQESPIGFVGQNVADLTQKISE